MPKNKRKPSQMKGQNIIPPPERKPLWKSYLEKFEDPIILILLIVFIFSVCISIYEIIHGSSYQTMLEPLGVFIALILATGIGFIFEVKANKEFEILNTVNDFVPVKVLRNVDGTDEQHITEIPKCDVEVGDIVKLESGDEIPADGILIRSISLRVDESNFTGEPWANKTTDKALFSKEATYPSNFLLRGSTILEGTALMKVTAIGLDTEEGKGIKKTREGTNVKTPLNLQLDQLGSWISKASMIIAILIIIGRMMIYFITDMGDNQDIIHTLQYILNSIMLAVTLIVVAVPEGLPMSITVSLALSMRKMLKENNLVRKLHACETMGATTVICTDKTGTLTQNQMTVVDSQFYTDDKELIYHSMALNSTADLEFDNGKIKVIGNPTEGALLKWLHKEKKDYYYMRKHAVILSRKPFSTEYKYMETTIQTKDGSVSYYKGAPERILGMCKWIAGHKRKEDILRTLSCYQQKGYRTLGFAVDNVFIGIVGIADPLRDDVQEAIHTCKDRAKVRVIIVTGDSPLTGAEIGRQIGLVDDHAVIITGPDFAALSDEDAIKLVKNPNFKLISRARPEDKARLVTLLQKTGEVVAVTGDGTNDAPALSKAQIGLSMGSGTARAKEASDITILDNSFSSINKAIMFGRSLYQNIKRFIVFQMTINLCACIIVLVGAFWGKESPLTVTQMLWVNLIMDTFAAMALSSLPADPRQLDRAPRKVNSHIIDKGMMKYILLGGLLFTAFLLYMWTHYAHFSLEEHSKFFTWFVMLQFWNLFNVRYFHTDSSLVLDIIHHNLKRSFSKGFWLITAIILLGQIFIVSFGGEMFTVHPLSIQQWLIIIGSTSLVFIVPEILRIVTNVSSSAKVSAQ